MIHRFYAPRRGGRARSSAAIPTTPEFAQSDGDASDAGSRPARACSTASAFSTTRALVDRRRAHLGAYRPHAERPRGRSVARSRRRPSRAGLRRLCRSMAAAARCSTTSRRVGGRQRIVEAHRRFGTTALLPTLVTDAPEVLARRSPRCAARETYARRARHSCRGAVHRSRRKGAHPERFIRDMTDAERRRLIAARVRRGDAGAGVGLDRTHERLARRGVLVSLGHSEATAEEARAASTRAPAPSRISTTR